MSRPRSIPLETPSIARNLNGKAGLAIAAFEGAQKVYGMGRDYWRNHFAYSVTVSDKDSLYSEVHDWMIATLPDERHRALSVTSSRVSRGDDAVADPGMTGEPAVKPLTVRFNENTSRSVTVEGFPVRIALIKPEGTPGEYREPEPSVIEFMAKSYQAQQAVLRLLEKLNAQRVTSRKPVLKMVAQWGNWTTRSDLPPRTMESVALPAEQKKRITDDLRNFLESENQYNRLAIPWHRGYMFYGPPGTGKTSLVKALANEFKLDLWYISLSDLKAESSLLSLLADVGPRSLLLLEDIDTMKITQDRDSAEQGKISMSSLLNTLDGVATPHGLITAMTTNRFDVLDPALTRAGRMDLVEELDYPTPDTLAQMYRHFYKKSPTWKLGAGDVPITGVSTAQIAETMKRHMADPKAAAADIVAMIEAARV